ncbi:MAG: polysaccharide deacetylase family protein [Prolixibacteraceae bacterium]|nr:polysaccharide deacetylase family protein [Prolixibacteraceae bacterium]
MRWFFGATRHLIALSVATFLVWGVCYFAMHAEQINFHTQSRAYAQSATVEKVLKLKKVKVEPARQRARAELPHPQKLSSPPLIDVVTKSINYLTKISEPYWPYRNGIDCAVMKCVALTFDDGPSFATPQLLDILKSKHAVATFFVVGYNIDANKGILRRMIAENNEIGNHTMSHKNFNKIPPQNVAAEINGVQDAVHNATGYKPHVLRPPYGAVRPGDLTQAMYPIVLWDNDPDDWKDRDQNLVDSRVMAPIKPGSIVLMHDLYPSSVNAVPLIIDNLQKQGYTLVTVSELFGWRDANASLPNGQVLRGR